MKKKSFWTILIKHFYGISGELDEYREQHVNRLGNRLFLLVWWYIFIQTFIAFCFILSYPQVVAWALLGTNFFVFIFVIPLYVLSQTDGFHLLECGDDDYEKLIQKMTKRARVQAIIYGPLMHLISSFLDYLQDGGNFWRILFHPYHFLIWFGAGVLMSYTFLAIAKGNITKIE